MQINLKYGKVLRETRHSFNEGHNVLIHKGGTGSGKTYEIMLHLAFSEAFNVKNEVITVVSESLPHLKIGAIRYLNKFISDYNLHNHIKVNATDKTYEFPTGTVIEFFSADRIGKALGARRYMLYGNEINTLKQSVWEELARRSKKVIGDFNPTAKFWLEDWMQYYPGTKIIKSNYKDNIALPRHETERIEIRAKKDKNFKRIHVDCEYGSADDLVFMPENIVLIDSFPNDLKSSLGMDFGWTAPSTLMRVASNKDDIYIHQIFYKPGLTEKDFANELKAINKTERINADSEDQRMINYIYNTLGYNVFSAKKPPGSVEFGISYLQGKTIHITKSSLQTIGEFRNLTYARDKNDLIIRGKYIGDDHAIDAVRYALDLETSPQSNFGGISF